MKRGKRRSRILSIAGAVVGLLFVALLVQTQFPSDEPPPYLMQSDDSRVENRTYLFTDTNEELPYSLFVSSKISPGSKSPLIVTLHGLGVGPGFMARGTAIDLAEEGGYILVSPLGYHGAGWYGTPIPLWMRNESPVGRAKLRELGEKDVMNVIDIVRREFNIDENRMYLMGHSMGGAGAYHLGVRHARDWAAIAAIAPATWRLDPDLLTPVKGTLAVLVVQGDADEIVSVKRTRRWIEWMKENGIAHEYLELPGVDHGRVIEAGMSRVFAFFAEHTRSAP